MAGPAEQLRDQIRRLREGPRRKTWRERCATVIASVIYDHRGESVDEIRKALRKAYPFGERANWPYKVWLDEIKIQIGQKRAQFDHFVVPAPGQKELF